MFYTQNFDLFWLCKACLQSSEPFGVGTFCMWNGYLKIPKSVFNKFMCVSSLWLSTICIWCNLTYKNVNVVKYLTIASSFLLKVLCHTLCHCWSYRCLVHCYIPTYKKSNCYCTMKSSLYCKKSEPSFQGYNLHKATQ